MLGRIEFNTFYRYDFTGMQKHFAKKAAKGYRVNSIGNYFIHYKKNEPAKVHYAVTYFPFSPMYEPEDEEEKTFDEFCEAAGWEQAANFRDLKVFVNENEDPLPLETDPEITFDNIETGGGGQRFGDWVVALIGLAILIVCGVTFREDPLWKLAGNTYTVLFPIYILYALCSVSNLISYYIWKRRALRALDSEELPDSVSNHWFMQLMLALGAAAVLISIFGTRGTGYGALAILISILVAYFVTDLARTAMRRRGVSGVLNVVVSLLICTAIIIPGFSLAYIRYDFAGYISHWEYSGFENPYDHEESYLPAEMEEYNTVFAYYSSSGILSYMEIEGSNYDYDGEAYYRYEETEEDETWTEAEYEDDIIYESEEKPEDYIRFKATVVKNVLPFLHSWAAEQLNSSSEIDSEEPYMDYPYLTYAEQNGRMIRIEMDEDPGEEALQHMIDGLSEL